MNKASDTNNYKIIARTALCLYSLFPDQIEKIKSNEIKDEIDYFLQHFELDMHNISNLEEFSTIFLFIKIFFPEKFSQIKITDKNWQEYKKIIKSDRQKKEFAPWNEIFRSAFNLALLAAPKIDFSKSDLKSMIQQESDFKSKTPPRPERRNF